MSKTKILLNGIIKENPTFVLLLGMCPTLGTTTSAIGGLGMGLFYPVCANLLQRRNLDGQKLYPR